LYYCRLTVTWNNKDPRVKIKKKKCQQSLLSRHKVLPIGSDIYSVAEGDTKQTQHAPGKKIMKNQPCYLTKKLKVCC
jgi:hypothetical protein